MTTIPQVARARREMLTTVADAAARHAQMGDFVPSTIRVPDEILEPTVETVDGLRVEYERYGSAEAPVSLAIGLPEVGVLVAQDLVYNRVHLFTGQNDLAGWESALRHLSGWGYTTIFPGHGVPGDVKALEEDLDYLAAAPRGTPGPAAGGGHTRLVEGRGGLCGGAGGAGGPNGPASAGSPQVGEHAPRHHRGAGDSAGGHPDRGECR